MRRTKARPRHTLPIRATNSSTEKLWVMTRAEAHGYHSGLAPRGSSSFSKIELRPASFRNFPLYLFPKTVWLGLNPAAPMETNFLP
jgi:hypothetical protein